MSKKGLEQKAKQLEEYYSQFPDWYWKFGLHDAKILSVIELQLPPDYKSQNLKYNCLEICLDAKNAMFEHDVKKISLFNYKILTPEIDINKMEKPWWIKDFLTQLPNNKYRLEIGIETARGKQKQFIVEFEKAETERNSP